jgi:hypothetical protein
MEGEKVLLKVKDFKLKKRKLYEECKGPFIITKVFPNQTALLKNKFEKHETLYNFIMLKHYNENEVKLKAKITKEAEEMSTKNDKQTHSKKPVEMRNGGGSIKRSKA